MTHNFANNDAEIIPKLYIICKCSPAHVAGTDDSVHVSTNMPSALQLLQKRMFRHNVPKLFWAETSGSHIELRPGHELKTTTTHQSSIALKEPKSNTHSHSHEQNNCIIFFIIWPRTTVSANGIQLTVGLEWRSRA